MGKGTTVLTVLLRLIKVSKVLPVVKIVEAQIIIKQSNTAFSNDYNTVELQWLEHLWDHENLFGTGGVRASEG